KLTQTGYTLGTPAYMSPEQCKGCASDERSDVYAFGCVMYEMLTGKTPVEGSNALELLHKQVGEKPAPLQAKGVVASAALEHVVAKALEKEPDERFQTAAELGAALDACLNQQASVSVSATKDPKKKPTHRTHSTLGKKTSSIFAFGFSAIALVALIVAAIFV